MGHQWAAKQIEDRHRHAWAEFNEDEEEAEEAAAKEKAARERWVKNHREEQREWLDDRGKRMTEDKEHVWKELRETERMRN